MLSPKVKTVYDYPLNFQFKIATFTPKFWVRDAEFRTIAFTKKKLFKLKEDVSVFLDETEMNLNYKIHADRWLDWSAVYVFEDKQGKKLGKIGRKGGRSLFKAHYELFDENDQQDLIIEEESFFTRFMDGLLGEIPILNFLTGYFFNPKYNVKRPDGTLVVQFVKQQSFWGRKFQLVKKDEFEVGEEQRILLGLIMLVFLERRRG